jgi:hypothetical protein
LLRIGAGDDLLGMTREIPKGQRRIQRWRWRVGRLTLRDGPAALIPPDGGVVHGQRVLPHLKSRGLVLPPPSQLLRSSSPFDENSSPSPTGPWRLELRNFSFLLFDTSGRRRMARRAWRGEICRLAVPDVREGPLRRRARCPYNPHGMRATILWVSFPAGCFPSTTWNRTTTTNKQIDRKTTPDADRLGLFMG